MHVNSIAASDEFSKKGIRNRLMMRFVRLSQEAFEKPRSGSYEKPDHEEHGRARQREKKTQSPKMHTRCPIIQPGRMSNRYIVHPFSRQIGRGLSVLELWRLGTAGYNLIDRAGYNHQT